MLTSAQRLYRILTFQMFILLITMIFVQIPSYGKDRMPASFSMSNIKYSPIKTIPGVSDDEQVFGDV